MCLLWIPLVVSCFPPNFPQCCVWYMPYISTSIFSSNRFAAFFLGQFFMLMQAFWLKFQPKQLERETPGQFPPISHPLTCILHIWKWGMTTELCPFFSTVYKIDVDNILSFNFKSSATFHLTSSLCIILGIVFGCWLVVCIILSVTVSAVHNPSAHSCKLLPAGWTRSPHSHKHSHVHKHVFTVVPAYTRSQRLKMYEC